MFAPVSVVIPSFNAGHLVGQALESVLNQTVVPAEILVIDDGSTDDTHQQVMRYSGRVRYLHQTNQGVSAARNLGVSTATQEFVAFLDADDVWHPHKVELQMSVFARTPSLGLVGTRQFAWPATRFPEVDTARSDDVTVVSWERLVVRNCLSTSSIMVRRNVLLRAGWFDPEMQGPEDRDLFLRVAEIAPVANLNLPLFGYRDVPGSLSKQARRCRDGMLRILEILDRRDVWRGRRLLRRKAYGYTHHSCAYLFGAAGDYPAALRSSLRSLLWYPLPYPCEQGLATGERLKRLLVNGLRWARLMPAAPTAPPASAVDQPDAFPRLLVDRPQTAG